MRLSAFAIATCVAFQLVGCALSSAPSAPAIRWLSMPALQASLAGTPPMAVGFDIDDTVLFSSPCFYAGQQKYSPGSEAYLHNPAFWQALNGGCDRYSIPKQSARALIALHQQRGDRIYFITGRPHTDHEQLTALLARTFAISNMQPVVFNSGPEKTRFIHDRHLKIYYGDADSDITSAREAGARPVRVMRAANSTYQPLPVNGALGEEVLEHSTY
ncbi:acid phosphatase/phosphotransferase [Pseudomonas sp. M47T1]|uniref:acid phosphatase AphA n=1 Tax=Pseudomonas sp. M47T1 TaxID=1179778 RepID=UPI0002608107|nr:acid phosphatase AphA [Pseudomonas sp. M47T1]EIK93365.1 acid phosphatase/phosphotransferase [Pseudomonas sp. M47T1]